MYNFYIFLFCFSPLVFVFHDIYIYIYAPVTEPKRLDDNGRARHRDLVFVLDIGSIVQYDAVVVTGVAQFFLGQIPELVTKDLSCLLDWKINVRTWTFTR